MKPINFKKWIDENKQFLKPPVGNRLIWEDAETIIQVVGGPNSRTDYHVNRGEEFFYQVEGNMILKVVEDGVFKDIPIDEGEIFLLKGGIPHSPQRFPNTVGLVIEHKRTSDEKDGLIWFCPNCKTEMYSEFFKLQSIVKDFPPVFDRYYNNADKCTCKKCGFKDVRKNVQN